MRWRRRRTSRDHASGAAIATAGDPEPTPAASARPRCSTPARVAILVGAGARGATDEVIEVAELLGAGVAKALLGKAALPDDLPFVTGAIGLLGTKPTWELMQELRHAAHGRLGFPVRRVPPRRRARPAACRSTSTPQVLGLRYPTEVSLVGDAAETLRALHPAAAQERATASWRQEIEANVRDWWDAARGAGASCRPNP